MPSNILDIKMRRYKPVDVAFFDGRLTNYDIKPVRDVFEMIGGKIEGSTLEYEGIQEIIPIEFFYHLPNLLRSRILKHLFKTVETVYAWSLNESAYFPRNYKLTPNKSTDPVIQAMVEEINFEDVHIPKGKQIPVAMKRIIWNTHIGKSIGKAKCTCCSTEITQMSFQCGYIVAEFHGGPSKISNVRPICQKCHSSMGKKTMEEFISTFKELRKNIVHGYEAL